MTIATTANKGIPDKTQEIYRFLWIGSAGPRVRLFESLAVFTGYVRECRSILGDDHVTFRTPFLAVGTFH
ncbi:MAG: hypothetical protein Q7K20_01050 [Polaromonas sp.]|nr:hypothetical protein [Polaromonas sp.]